MIILGQTWHFIKSQVESELQFMIYVSLCFSWVKKMKRDLSHGTWIMWGHILRWMLYYWVFCCCCCCCFPLIRCICIHANWMASQDFQVSVVESVVNIKFMTDGARPRTHTHIQTHIRARTHTHIFTHCLSDGQHRSLHIRSWLAMKTLITYNRLQCLKDEHSKFSSILGTPFAFFSRHKVVCDFSLSFTGCALGRAIKIPDHPC